MNEPRSFEDLVRIMDRLRDPGGCPWDREQSYATLRGYLLEECYEVVEALDSGDREALCEELGDLLFEIVFLSRLAQEEGRFDAARVVRGIGAKIVRRHPHVFAGAEVTSTEDVLRTWEEIKRQEKRAAAAPAAEAPEPGSVLSGIPRALPALLKAHRLGEKAARVGFDWKRPEDVFLKVEEEWGELRGAAASGERERVVSEMGDLLFSLVMLARHLRIDPEEALERTNHKFRTRFEAVERGTRERGIPLEDADQELLDRLWEAAKEREAGGGAL